MTYTVFGESHGPAIGVVVSGLPSGVLLDIDAIGAEMARRAPGKDRTSTARKEPDVPEILSGVFEGKTTGTPLAAIIRNTDTRSGDYSKLKDLPRPGHGDYAGFVRYAGYNDYRGGGHFSGRLTAPLVFAGAVAKQILAERGITVSSRISMLGGVKDPTDRQVDDIILAARDDGDSVGGCIAVKTRTNHAGGINGGITNGMPVTFEVVIRPTPSIAREQQTVSLSRGTDETLVITGRHDPCIVKRAMPVIEAAAALAAMELIGI